MNNSPQKCILKKNQGTKMMWDVTSVMHTKDIPHLFGRCNIVQRFWSMFKQFVN